jgi:hypothetical protein
MAFETVRVIFDAAETDLRLFVFDIDTGPVLPEKRPPGTLFGNDLSLPRTGDGPDPSFLVPLLAGLRAKDERIASEEALVERMTKSFERTLDVRIAAFESRIEKRLTRIETLLIQIAKLEKPESAPVERPSWIPPGVTRPSGVSTASSYIYNSSQYWSSESETRLRGSQGKDKEVEEMNELAFM